MIVKSNTKNITIIDSVLGTYTTTINEFNKNFNYVLLIPKKEDNFSLLKERNKGRSYDKWNIIVNLFSKRYVFLLIFLTLVTVSFELLLGYSIQIIIDKIIPNEEVRFLYIMSAFITIYYFIVSIIKYLRNRLTYNISLNITENLFSDFIQRILSQPYTFFTDKKIGYFSTRLADIMQISNNLLDLLINLVLNVGMVLIFSFIIGILNFKFIFFFLIYVLIYLYISRYFTKKMYVNYNIVREQSSILENTYIKTFTSIFSIKTFSNIQKSELYLNEEIKNNNSKLKMFLSTQNKADVSLSLLQTSFLIIILTWGASNVIANSFTIGNFVLLTMIAQYVIQSFSSITKIQPMYQMTKVSIDRLYSTINNIKSNDNNPIQNKKDIPFKAISFVNISLAIEEREVISNLNLNLNFNKNHIIAIKGDSGIGKSSLMATIIKLFPITNGNIYIDNYNIDNINTNFLRESILLLNQNPENLPGYLETIDCDSIGDLRKLLDLFGLSQELYLNNINSIKELSTYNDNLSGGQKQRLYLCLGLLKRPKIIILDETLSGLNVEWINKFISYVKSNNIKTIIISHDENIISKCSYTINLNEINANVL